jgi:hypothetical protein
MAKILRYGAENQHKIIAIFMQYSYTINTMYTIHTTYHLHNTILLLHYIYAYSIQILGL